MFNKYFWKDLWYKQVVTRLFPRQKWLTDKIPRTWCDADHLIETCLFETIIFFWEEDGGEEQARFQYECDYTEGYGLDKAASDARRAEKRIIYDRLQEAYNWAKIRDRMDPDISEAILDMKRYINDKEEFEKQETFFLKEIIELRKSMWT